MTSHSSTLAWKIPWTEEPGGLQCMGSHSWTRLKRLRAAATAAATQIQDILLKSYLKTRSQETFLSLLKEKKVIIKQNTLSLGTHRKLSKKQEDKLTWIDPQLQGGFYVIEPPSHLNSATIQATVRRGSVVYGQRHIPSTNIAIQLVTSIPPIGDSVSISPDDVSSAIQPRT